jgi:periplasmic divalent cation tolerance protein
MAAVAKPILVLTNVPDTDVARTIGRELVESRLAACVNYLPQVTSIYRWQNAIEEATEITLLVKTVQERYAEVQAMITRLHPYDLPEIIALTIEHGSPAYLKWIEQETKANETP